jgi:hypothetical protein
LDKNNSFARNQLPLTSDPDFIASGAAQVGSHTATGTFGTLNLPAGEWILEMRMENTGASMKKIETSLVGTATPAPEVVSFSLDPVTKVLNLSFTSSAGANYALEYTTGFRAAGVPTSAAQWNVVTGYSSIVGAAGTTAITPLNTATLVAPGGQLPDNRTSYFRIRRL